MSGTSNPTNPSGRSGSPQTPYYPIAPPPSQGRQAAQPKDGGAFGLGIPINDWEAALLLYGIGLFVVETDFGQVYLLGAWAAALIMFLAQIKQAQKG